MVVAELKRVNEENQKLKSMVRGITSQCYYLQKQISFLLQQQKRVDGSQKFSTDHHSITAHTGRNEQGGVKGKKNVEFMEDYQLPSKKRKINYMQSEQIEYGINSSVDDSSPCCQGESSNKMHQLVPNRGSGQQIQEAKPKRVVVARSRSEESARGDGCQWRKYGQKTTKSNPLPRSYYRCAWAPSCPVKKQVQRSVQDPTVLITTYEGEHTHALSPLAMAIRRASSSNQLISERSNIVNSVADNQLIPIARISTSSPFPTITLDLTDDQPNPGLPLQLPSLAAGSFQHSTPVPNSMGLVFDQNPLDHLAIMNSVASIKADPNFTAALGIAIAGSVLRLGDPAQGMMPKFPPTTNGSTL